MHKGNLTWLKGLFIALLLSVVVDQGAGLVTLCPGVATDNTGQSDSGPQWNQCIAQTPSGGLFSPPPGVYALATQVVITHPIRIQTQGTANTPACLQQGSAPCARLIASPQLYANGGLLYITPAAAGSVIDHIILDGNQNSRLSSRAASDCHTGANNRATGYNGVNNAELVTLSASVSMNALCGSGFVWSGAGGYFGGNAIQQNGNHFALVVPPNVTAPIEPPESHPTFNVSKMSVMMNRPWRGRHKLGALPRYSDGITLLNGNAAKVLGNLFYDNTDVNLILGSGNSALIQSNTFEMSAANCFAGIMLDNFDGSTVGDYRGLTASANNIQCNFKCDFGIQVGPRPWYNPINNVYGGFITGNQVVAAGILIDVDGGGVPSIPVSVYGNGLLQPSASWRFSCGVRPGALLNIAPGSYVNRNGETYPITQNPMNGCY